MLQFKAFRAVDEESYCKEFLKGHLKVLIDYGIPHLTSNNQEWPSNPHVYCIVAIDEEGEMVGGERVQMTDGIFPLPVEDAVGTMDSKIYDTIKYYAKDGGVGESCGLWNSKKVQGMGISLFITWAIISMINQIGFQTLVGLCGNFTLDMFQKMGYVINKELGNKGGFPYPKPDMIANVLGIMNALSLATAHPFDKERMLTLRNKPRQKRKELGPKGEVEIEYDLLLPNISELDKNIYAAYVSK